jgi:6-phosphofructokinase 1
MDSKMVSNIIQRGGTILKSARSEEFRTKIGREKAYAQLQERGIEGLVCCGGNGSFTGAEIFYKEYGVPTVGVAGTIDNDLYGTDYTLGYDTAVNTALDAIDKIRDTADSHDRVFFIEVMGRDSGYIAIQSGIGGGAEIVMVPENPDTIDGVVETLQAATSSSRRSSSIVVVAEGEEIGNAQMIAAQVKERLPKLDIRVTNLGHIQRGGSPTAIDRLIGSRLGLAAVEGLIEGKTNVMAGIINDKIVYTPFDDAIRKKKPLNADLIKLVNILSI